MGQEYGVRASKSYFENRFLYLIILIFLMLLAVPILSGFAGVRLFLDIFMTAILISTIYAVSERKHVSLIALLLALPMIVSMWTGFVLQESRVILVGNIFGVLFFVFTIIRFQVFIFREDEVNLNLIFAAAVVYLLMAIMWSYVHSSLESINPGSYSIPPDKGIHGQFLFVYYSFVTTSTLGYGDITPLSSLARSLTIIEAVTGQLFIAVLIAWLVGVYISRAAQKGANPD
jgi:hypothetical protein